MQCTASPIAVDSEVAGKVLNAIIPALECAGFTVADHSVSVHGLVITGPGIDGHLEISFNPLPDVDDSTPDEGWSDPRRLAPVCGGAIDVDQVEPDASFDEWLDQVDRLYPPVDQVEPARPSYLAPENLIAVRRTLWGV